MSGRTEHHRRCPRATIPTAGLPFLAADRCATCAAIDLALEDQALLALHAADALTPPPWGYHVIEALNASQRSGHGYTCPRHPARILTATCDGWICSCGYRQETATNAQVILGLRILGGETL